VSTLPLIYSDARAGGKAPPAAPKPAQKAPLALAAALLLVIVYAAFAHGAVSLTGSARIEVALAAITAVAGAAWLWTGGLRLAAPPAAAAGACLLAAFAVWSGITLLWSVAPDQTWSELNRAIGYVLVLCLAFALGASYRGAVELVARGFVAVALAVSIYGLGQKLLPGLHVGGLFNLNQTAQIPRLQEPLGYWNALALFLVLGVPMALALAVDVRSRRSLRLGALVALQLMLLTIGLTYSRGGLIALAVALIVGIGFGPARLRSLAWLALTVVALLPPLILGLANHSLTAANVSLAHREGAGAVLLAVLAVSVLGLVLTATRLQVVESRTHFSPARARRVGRWLAIALAVLCVAGVLSVALSSRGLPGTVSHAWKSFTATREASNYDPHRLLSAASENRWVWWKEAAGAFSDRPLAGWGAGSFAVVHLMYRHNRLSVTQPHSVPLQFLSETGVVGAVLAFGAFALLLSAAVRRVRRSSGRRRTIEAALLAGAAAYLVHSFYDWDWDIPALTIPALMFLGVVAGGGGERRIARPSLSVRGLLLAGLTLWLCVFATSSVLPSLAASKAADAVVAAAGTSPSALAHAQASAELATQLDPLSDSGLKVQSTIAQRRGNLSEAARYLLAAVRRDPSDRLAWSNLAFIEFTNRDFADAQRTAQRGLELDPRGAITRSVARSIDSTLNLYDSPPRESGTARPLSAGAGR
jgi:hypothetical protein